MERRNHRRNPYHISSSVGAELRTEVLCEVIDQIGASLESQGIDKPAADKAARETVEALRKYFGGCNVYFPKGTLEDSEALQKEILQAWREGEKIHHIALRLNVSMARAYNVVKMMRGAPSEREAANDSE